MGGFNTDDADFSLGLKKLYTFVVRVRPGLAGGTADSQRISFERLVSQLDDGAPLQFLLHTSSLS